jgi:hypothetical protein
MMLRAAEASGVARRKRTGGCDKPQGKFVLAITSHWYFISVITEMTELINH